MQDRTHFGFQSVDEDEKASRVRGVFDSVANRYDVMNDLMSAGLHRLWKNTLVSWLAPRSGQHIIDVAGGTGDIAFRILKKAQARVTVLDINKNMLKEGRNRAIDKNLLSLEWACADAETLPLSDNCCDAYTIAFGIRNVTHIEKALSEAYRVLKPGGRFLCLEFSQVAATVQPFYDMYSFKIIPQIGQWITGDREAYQYLVESIRRFPAQQDFLNLMKKTGFENAYYKNLTQGVVAIHSGRKL